MRKTIIVVVLALIVAAAAAIGLGSRNLRRDAAGRVAAAEQQLRERTGFVTDSPNVSVEMFPPAAVLTGGKLREKGGGAEAVVAENGTIRVVSRSADLLGGGFVPERIELRGVRFIIRPDTKFSAVGVLPALREATFPVVLTDCVLQLDRGSGFPPFEITNINMRLAPGTAIPFAGTASPLGPSSHAEIKGEWRPGAGRTGGDGLELHVQVRDGEPEAIGRLVPDARVSELRGGARFDIAADGFVGERSTESLPAEPLKGHVRAESDIELFGLRVPVVFDNEFTFDDRRWVLGNGQGRWGERTFTYAGWIARGYSDNKVNLRAEFADVSVADVLAEYGIADRWRPQARASGEVRMGGTLSEPLTRYDAKIDGARFDGFPRVPVSTGPVNVSGSLLAVNAEASGSFTAQQLKIGDVAFDHMLIGVNWWRGKLNVTSLAQQYWDGKLDAAASYSPSESSDATGGGLLRSVEAKAALATFFPDLDTGIEGRLDASVHGGYRAAQGLWYEGRFELRNGSVARGIVRAVADRAVSAAGGAPTANDALVASHPALSPSRTALSDAKGAFSARQAPIDFELTNVESDEVALRGSGTLNEDRHVEADGVATFTASLVHALAQNAPPLAKLAAGDGTLAVPFHAKGAVNDFAVELAPSFTAALEKARSGAAVEPFAAPPAPEPLKLEIPPLDEELGE